MALFIRFSRADICEALYTTDGCPICITHYADRECGWCENLKKCVSLNESSQCSNNFIFGPNADCTTGPKETPVPPAETPTPAPIPEDQCSIFELAGGEDACNLCQSHYADRGCGFCKSTGHCIHVNTSDPDSQCPYEDFYYGGKTKCFDHIPPKPKEWPRYDAEPDFCKNLSGTWCSKCVSSNVEMKCGWCAETKECIMGDEQGPYFLTCQGGWEIEETDRCLGKSSHSAIIGMRAGIGVAISIITILAIIGCYVVIRKPKSGYENL